VLFRSDEGFLIMLSEGKICVDVANRLRLLSSKK
jgi:hypothetical protein